MASVGPKGKIGAFSITSEPQRRKQQILPILVWNIVHGYLVIGDSGLFFAKKKLWESIKDLLMALYNLEGQTCAF